jgi:acyl-CoA dehydrogenase
VAIQYLPTELTEVTRLVARFVDQELRPIVEDYESRQRFPVAFMPKMGELGFFGAAFPEAVGGTNLGKLGQSLIVQELSKASGGIGATVLVQVLSIYPIFRYGTPAQQETYLLPGIQGQKIACIAVTEPNHGSDVAGIETTAVRDGTGYRLNGSKMFITNSPFADFLVVAAKTENHAADPHHQITLFIVERNNPGLQVGPHLQKLGWFTSETAPVYLDNCWVPETAVIGEAGQGFYYIMDDFNFERLLLSAQCVGLAEEALNIALRYARERTQFGQPIGAFQAIRHKLAAMATQIEAGRLLLLEAASQADQGQDSAIKTASMAKYFCAEMVNRVAYDAIQVLGGAGYLRDYPLERIYRDARILPIGGGTSEIQLNIIARQLGL